MKTSGIIRNIDDLGRIVVPKEMRRTLGINNSDPVEIFQEDDKIIIKRFEETCIFCGSDASLSDFRGKKLCASCLEEIKG